MAERKLSQARNELIVTVQNAWRDAPALIGKPGPFAPIVIVAFDDDGNPNDNNNKKPWMRVRIQHTQSRATSISNRVYRNEGTLTANIFVIREKSDAGNVAELIGDCVKLALRQHRGVANTKDVTLRERPINNGFSQVDVSAGFWWTEFARA